ncbi:MAG: DUF928 domain-containing protein [Oscillatoriales cyanobacterium SM2_3_0]|nr:DUF928 domain-containing protein [Oscillatoriales cyanobacterium SM2_3_0]
MAIPASARSYSPATTQTTHLLNQQANLTFPPTEDRGAPSRTRGSGSRGPCGDGSDSALSDIALTALMPANNIGTTISSHPAVYVYVPKTSGKSAEFTLYNWTTRERAAVYEAQVPVANLSGIVKIPLPETVNLEPENTYVWVFSIVCNAQDRSQDQYVSGWIERVSLKSDQQATIEDTQQPSEKAALYASAGIWHETLEILEQLRSTDPQIWRTFLDSVGLGEISEQQVIECCQSQSSL